MNTLKLTDNPKDARRLAYDDRRQDHGDRGTQGYKNQYSSDMKAELVRARDRVEMDEALQHMSPRQLEAVATTMLRGAGLEDPTDYASLGEEEAELDNLRDDNGLVAYGSGVNKTGFVDVDDDEVHASYVNAFQAEMDGALDDGRRARADADLMYEGISSEDYAEFIDGFSITDRPL